MSDKWPALEELAFFGKLAASFTHELNNVLAIIDQNTGLLEDLADMATGDKPVDPAKIRKTAGTMDKHMDRGRRLVKSFNRFAHSADAPVMEFELGEALDIIALLSERLARRESKEIRVEPPPSAQALAMSPFLFYMTIFGGIGFFMRAEGEGEIVLGGGPADGNAGGSPEAGAGVSIAGPALSAQAQEEAGAFLSRMMERLGGDYIADWENGKIGLVFPRSVPEE